MSELKSKLNRFREGMRGELWKQGKVIKKWKTRYFILEKKILKCFNDSSSDNLHGELAIDESLQIYDVPDETEEKKFAFYLVGKSTNQNGSEEVMLLAASSDKEKQDWIEALSDAVHDGFKQIFQPDLWPSSFYPSVEMFVSYSGNFGVENGNILRPYNTESPPKILLRGIQPEERFSFIMLDIDPISTPENANSKYFLHWGVVNFTGNDISSGDELAPYVPPAPVYNSGLHRFFCLLFKQRNPISAIQLSEIVELFTVRDGFDFSAWVKRMSFLGNPAAINGYYAGWEEYCDVIHERVGYVPPEQYRSPTQETRVIREQEKQRLETAKFTLYKDLNLRDIFGFADDDSRLRAQTNGALENVKMKIQYADVGHLSPLDGTILGIEGAQSAPEVFLDNLGGAGSYEQEYYTLIMTDPDAPSRLKPDLREFVHWVVVNVDSLAGDVSGGEEVAAYLGPAPPYSSGLHRYVFTLYKQKDKFSEAEIEAAKTHFAPRGGLKTFGWVKSQSEKLYTMPLAIDAFLSEWEIAVDDIHEKMGWLPPDPFRSPKQKLQAMQKDVSLSYLNNLEMEERMLRDRTDALEAEQLERLKAAQLTYQQQAKDIEFLAISAAVRGTADDSLLASGSADSSMMMSNDSADEADGVSGGAIPVASSSLPHKNSGPKLAHRVPASFHSQNTAVASASNDNAAFEDYLAKNTTKVADVDAVMARANVGDSVVLSQETQSTTVATTERSVTGEQEIIERQTRTTGSVSQIQQQQQSSSNILVSKIDEELEAMARRDRALALEREQKEAQRLKEEAEAKETARLEEERKKAERREKLRKEREEEERAEAERLRVQAEKERVAREQAEQERLERERAEKERLDQLERERLQREKEEQERLQRLVEEQKRIIEVQQQQQQLLLQQQQLFIQQQQQLVEQADINNQQQQQTSQQQNILRSRSGGSNRQNSNNGVFPEGGDSEDENAAAPPPSYYNTPSSSQGHHPQPSPGSGSKRATFAANVSPASPNTQFRKVSADGKRSRDSSPLPRANTQDSDEGSSRSHRSSGGRPAVGFQRTPTTTGVGNRSPLFSGLKDNKGSSADDFDALLSPGKSTVGHEIDYDDMTVVSGNSFVPPPTSSSSVNSNAAYQQQLQQVQQQQHLAAQQMLAQQPVPPATGSPRAHHQPSAVSQSNSAPPVQSLMRKVSLFKPQSQFITVPPMDDSDAMSASSATSGYNGGGGSGGGSALTSPSGTGSMGFGTGGAGSVTSTASVAGGRPATLKQTTSMYLKTGAGAISQDRETGPGGLSASELRDRLRDPRTTTAEKCAIFGILTTGVFDGEGIRKKFTKDFLLKESFMWIDPLTKSLHWGKGPGDRTTPANSKFINLDRVNALDDIPVNARPQGEMKGLFRSLEIVGTTLTITCESGDQLILKMNDGNPPAAKRAADWAKLIRAFEK